MNSKKKISSNFNLGCDQKLVADTFHEDL